VQSIQFKKLLPVGEPGIIIEFLCSWGIDEIIILDIEAGQKNSGPNSILVEAISQASDVPLTYGGGIKTSMHATQLIAKGVDKIALNSAFISNRKILKEISETLGAQSIVVSLDFRKNGKDYELFNHSNKTFQKIEPEKLATQFSNEEVGEVLVTSIDNYGMKNGYDVELMKKFTDNTDLPVIALGGGYRSNQIIDLAQATNVTSFAIENALLFKEHSVAIYKALISQDLMVREDVLDEYQKHKYDVNERINKRDEKYLSELFYERVVRREI
jgi:imidazole glycerol-phosphate synthase subunit HisF